MTRARSFALAVTIGVVAAALGGCSGPGAATSSSSTSTTLTPTTAAHRTSLLRDVETVTASPLGAPQLWITASGTYLSWWSSPPADGVHTDLAELDLSTGRVGTTLPLRAGEELDALDATNGSLYVTESGPRTELLQLSPRTLSVTSIRTLPVGAVHLAVAGGSLWLAGGDELVRFSLPDLGTESTVPLPGAVSSDVAASSDGSVLVASDADASGRGSVQVRDPRTGAVIRTSAPLTGIASPTLGTVTTRSVWLSESTGMLGYAEELDLATLRPAPASVVHSTNGISFQLGDGLGWISTPVDDEIACVNLSTGVVRAWLQLARQGSSTLLAVEHHRIYFSRSGSTFQSSVESAPVPASCAH